MAGRRGDRAGSLIQNTMKRNRFGGSFQRVKKGFCRGGALTCPGFCKAKSIRRQAKNSYFPSGNPKIKDFRRAGRCPAPTVSIQCRFFDSLTSPLQIAAGFCISKPFSRRSAAPSAPGLRPVFRRGLPAPPPPGRPGRSSPGWPDCPRSSPCPRRVSPAPAGTAAWPHRC